MVARSAAQRAASLRNLAKARAALRGRTSATGGGATAKASDVTGSNRANVRYRKTRLRRVRIRL